MPFLKYSKKIPRSRQIENAAAKNGLRKTVYGLNGSEYTGEWENNKKQGKGTMRTKSHILYEGEWKDNKPGGFGVLCYPNPNKKTFYLAYRGQFGDGQKNTTGTYHRNTGDYYVGDFKDGKRHGYGMLWNPDGSFYAGDFFNGYCEGSGTYVRTDGNRYDGEWKGGLKHGRGRFFHLNKGQMQTGVWLDNVCVFSVIENIPYRQCALFPTAYPINSVAMDDLQTFFEDYGTKILTGEKDSCFGIGGENEDEKIGN